MKKLIIYSLAFLLILLILFSQFGIQIGNIRIGKQIDFSPFQKNDIENSNFFNEFYSKDKIICINTWATWCVPCMEEMPTLNSIKKHYTNDSIEFLSLSIDDDSLKLADFLKTGKFQFRDITLKNIQYRNSILNLLEGKRLDAYIPTKSVPNTYLIKNKKIIQKFEGLIDTAKLKLLIEKNLKD